MLTAVPGQVSMIRHHVTGEGMGAQTGEAVAADTPLMGNSNSGPRLMFGA